VRLWGQNGLVGPVEVGRSRAVRSGYGFVCVLEQDETVRCHGLYSVHESVARVDGPVPSLRSVASLSSGFEHSCAVTHAGRVYCWGRNNIGQLGDGTTTYSVEAHEVVNLNDVVQVSCGREHSCALTSDGSVYCWGSNAKGELGDGTLNERHTPVRVM
jgi:alpha-tubulin suppressor-like RCC1 family protein